MGGSRFDPDPVDAVVVRGFFLGCSTSLPLKLSTDWENGMASAAMSRNETLYQFAPMFGLGIIIKSHMYCVIQKAPKRIR